MREYIIIKEENRKKTETINIILKEIKEIKEIKEENKQIVIIREEIERQKRRIKA